MYDNLHFHPTAAEATCGISVDQVINSTTELKVTWPMAPTRATSTIAPATGYLILYKADGDQGSVEVNDETTTMKVIDVNSTELKYTISIITLSDELPSKQSLSAIYSKTSK